MRTASYYGSWHPFSKIVIMKYRLSFLVLAIICIITVKAQCVIPIQIEQSPPLSVVAQTVTVTLPIGGVTLGSDLTVEGGDGVYNYQWTDIKGEILGISSTLSVTTSGDFYLKVADNHDCSVSVKYSVLTTERIENVNGGELTIIYKDGHLTVESVRSLDQIRIVGVSGQLVKKISNIRKMGTININLSTIEKGIYMVGCAYTDGNEIVKRLIIK